MEQEKLTNQKETLVFLSQKYPKCFFLEGPVKPLKIGIFQDIAQELGESEVVSKRLLRTSLRHYTSSWRYLSAVKEGAVRVNLAGEDAEVIEKEHADHAATQLKESKAKAASIREAKKREHDKSSKPSNHKGYSANAGEKREMNKDGKSLPNTKSKHKKGSYSGPSRNKPASKLKAVTPIADTDISIGNTALVKLGKEPMPVTITDIGKDGVSVQLNSGMTVKVQRAQLRLTI